jgi:hypothetical protein
VETRNRRPSEANMSISSKLLPLLASRMTTHLRRTRTFTLTALWDQA